MTKMGSHLKMSSAFHPQSDGQTERMNRVLEDMLRNYVDPAQHDWDQHLPMADGSRLIIVLTRVPKRRHST